MLEPKRKDHEIVLLLKREAKARNAKTARKPLWKYKLYVVGNYLVIDCLWPAVQGEGLPEVDTHGRDLYKGLVRMQELACQYGLQVRLYSRYGRKIDSLLQYFSKVPRPAYINIHRIGTDPSRPPDETPLDLMGANVLLDRVYVYDIYSPKILTTGGDGQTAYQSVKEATEIDVLLPDQRIPE